MERKRMNVPTFNVIQPLNHPNPYGVIIDVQNGILPTGYRFPTAFSSYRPPGVPAPATKYPGASEVKKIKSNPIMKEESIIDQKHFMEFRSSGPSYNLDKDLSFEVKAMHNHLRLSGDEHVLPVMVSVKTKDSPASGSSSSSSKPSSNPAKKMEMARKEEAEDLSRPSLDLVCVIDISGSMQNDKIDNVKQTLLQLVDMLGIQDRISLIVFNKSSETLCNLRQLNNENKKELRSIICQITVGGGTDIFKGLTSAFEVLQKRKQSNQVTSIFLLSDGKDDLSYGKTVEYMNNTKAANMIFTIHSFGFGKDHDGPLMNKLAELRDGNFYYIEKVSQIDEFFVDALGGLFSVVAQEVEITVKLNQDSDVFRKFFKGTQIVKTYGNMWKPVTYGLEYKISIKQLFSGVSKDFICEVIIPRGQYISKLLDFERNIELIRAEIVAQPVDIVSSTRIVKEGSLILTLFDAKEAIMENSEVDDNVEFNFIRVKAAAAMEDAIRYSEMNQYQFGQEALQMILYRIDGARPINQVRLKALRSEVMECQANAKPEVFAAVGRQRMFNCQTANFKQNSQAQGEGDMYANCFQRKMVAKQKMMKNAI